MSYSDSEEGNTPYSCPHGECDGFTFNTKEECAVHESDWHSPPYRCHVCNENFAARPALKRHLRASGHNGESTALTMTTSPSPEVLATHVNGFESGNKSGIPGRGGYFCNTDSDLSDCSDFDEHKCIEPCCHRYHDFLPSEASYKQHINSKGHLKATQLSATLRLSGLSRDKIHKAEDAARHWTCFSKECAHSGHKFASGQSFWTHMGSEQHLNPDVNAKMKANATRQEFIKTLSAEKQEFFNTLNANQGRGLFRNCDAGQGRRLFGPFPPNQGIGLSGNRDVNQGAGLFGNRDAVQGGGLFGNRDANQGGGFFGAPPPNQGVGLFGNRDANQGGAFFGASPPSQGTGLFGNRDAGQGPGLFGTLNAGTAGFGNVVEYRCLVRGCHKYNWVFKTRSNYVRHMKSVKHLAAASNLNSDDENSDADSQNSHMGFGEPSSRNGLFGNTLPTHNNWATPQPLTRMSLFPHATPTNNFSLFGAPAEYPAWTNRTPVTQNRPLFNSGGFLPTPPISPVAPLHIPWQNDPSELGEQMRQLNAQMAEMVQRHKERMGQIQQELHELQRSFDEVCKTNPSD